MYEYSVDYLGFELEKWRVGKGHLLKEEKWNMWPHPINLTAMIDVPEVKMKAKCL